MRFRSNRTNSASSADKLYRIVPLLVALLLVSAIGATAEDNPADTAMSDPPPCDTCQPVIIADTILYVPPPVLSSGARVNNPVNLEEHLYQNPTLALFKSMFVPGWGQYGNHRYVKAGVIVGLQAWFITSAVHYGRQASDARDLYESAITIEDRNTWHDFLDNKRKNRNKFIWFAGIVTFLSMFDAYVDAHLSGSPLEQRHEQADQKQQDKLSFDIVPDEDGVKASLSLNFY